MRILPRRSPGVLLSPLDGRAVAVDLLTSTTHHLNPSAGALLASCDGATSVGEAVTAWAAGTGTDPSSVATDVEAGLTTLAELGLVGRTTAFETPEPPMGSTAIAPSGARRGAVHQVIDWAITFRSAHPDLLELIDARLVTGAPATGTPILFDVVEEPDGQVLLLTDHEHRSPSRPAFLDGLPSVLNRYAGLAHTCVVLHAGAVRSPGGEILLLPAPSGSGKSTLTAALVAAGWDYLGDETIGVRAGSAIAVGYPKRLAIDPVGLGVLGLAERADEDLDPAELRPGVVRLSGDVGPVARVVLPRYVADADLTVTDLDLREAFDALLLNTVNLSRTGESGLDALCDLAGTARTQRLTYGDARQAAELLTSGSAR